MIYIVAVVVVIVVIVAISIKMSGKWERQEKERRAKLTPEQRIVEDIAKDIDRKEEILRKSEKTTEKLESTWSQLTASERRKAQTELEKVKNYEVTLAEEISDLSLCLLWINKIPELKANLKKLDKRAVKETLDILMDIVNKLQVKAKNNGLKAEYFDPVFQLMLAYNDEYQKGSAK